MPMAPKRMSQSASDSHPLPWNNAERTPSNANRSGEAFPIGCSHCGSVEIGKTEPLRSVNASRPSRRWSSLP